MIVFNAAIILLDYKGRKQCIFKSRREFNFVLDYGVQRCQITEVVFYTKVLVNDILVGLDWITQVSDERGLTVLFRLTIGVLFSLDIWCVRGRLFWSC